MFICNRNRNFKLPDQTVLTYEYMVAVIKKYFEKLIMFK